jgi:hypothetical protein
VEYFAATSDGWLLAANGIDPVLRWDGLTPNMETAGTPAPPTALTLGSSTSGSITGTYFAYSRWVDAQGNVSDLSPLADSITVTSVGQIDYTDVPVPTDPKVRARQILRNTTGQTGVFYVDVETNDLTTTSFSSTRSDSDLQGQEAVALFDSLGMPLANVHGVPPSDKSILAAHLDRMFLAGEETYSVGSVDVTFGSTTVSGIGTEWPESLAGRFLWVAGASKSYEIESVDTVSQTLTLLEAYESPSSPYASYGIRAPVAQRRLVQFSEAGLPESWPVINALSVQEDGDEITGLMPMGSFLYIVEKRHIYRLSFQTDPTDDGFIFLSCNRGCINSRCWAVVDEAAYLMDEAGVYKFSGSRQTEVVSEPIQDLFEPPRTNKRYRIRFDANRYFHCVYDPGTQSLRWFVCLTGTTYPRHALCFDIRGQRWWVEEFPFPIASSCIGLLDGERRVFLGGPSGRVYLLGHGTLDLVNPVRGTVRSVVTSRSPMSISDTLAGFGDDLVGAPVVMLDGVAKGHWRRIVEVNGTTLRLDRPWTIKPAVGDAYQVGGIQWRYRTGWFRWAQGEQENPRRLEILHEPCNEDQFLEAYLYQDRSQEPVVWGTTYPGDELSSMGTVADDPAIKGDLTNSLGFMQRRLDGFKEFYIDGPRFVSWELKGVTNQDQAVIYEMTVDGATGSQQ